MFYGFIDGRYVGSANHIKYLKKMMDEDMELFNGCFAVIYKGKRSYQCRSWDGQWNMFQSSKPDRPELPEHVKKS